MAEKIIDVSTLKVGMTYDRKYLAQLWGYNGVQGLSRGIVTAKGSVVVLFITQQKTKWDVQYEDQLHDGILMMDGQAKHMTDKAVMDPQAKIYSFYRTERKQKNKGVPFTYLGEVKLIQAEEHDTSPNHFMFKVLALSVAAYPGGGFTEGSERQI